VFCAGGERGMGAGESRSLRAATLTHLDINAELWEQIQCEDIANVQDVFRCLPGSEIRKLREHNPSSLATLCCKLVEKLTLAVESSCRTQSDQQSVLNSCRVLTRLVPFIFEDPDWRSFFWSKPQIQERREEGQEEVDANPPLAHSLILAVSDLLFCPEFTVSNSGNKGRDEVDELENLDSCEHIWEKGVGFAQNTAQIPQQHYNRCELLRLLLTCFSQTIYLPPQGEAHMTGDRWVNFFTSHHNRHALPLFTSLLNTVCGYVPGGIMPYNHLIWTDSKEKLVELSLQVLIVCLDQEQQTGGQLMNLQQQDSTLSHNLFLNYLSRIHRDEDFELVLHGITRLLMNPLNQTYLPYSQRKVYFHQELLLFFWKMCEHNKKFLFYVLKSSDVLEILIPILHYLNDARADQSRVGLMHIGVFILLLLSGERNFGVRLNKPYTAAVPMDIPIFSGSHGDLLIIVFHKIITSGHARLQPLFDCLLTVLCNVSPYIKSMSMVAACKLVHLVEAFSTPWFLLSSPTNHHLVYFLLETLNNIIQYQFDGNYNLIYTIIRKRSVFHNLANLPVDSGAIHKILKKKKVVKRKSSQNDISMEGSYPALPAQPGTLKASLIKFPGVNSLTEAASAHPSQRQLDRLTQSIEKLNLDAVDAGMFAVQPTSSSTEEEGCGVGNLLDEPHHPGLATESGQKEDQAGNKRTRQSPTEKKSRTLERTGSVGDEWEPTAEWINSWRSKLPLHTVMRLLQVLVPQVEKMCMDKGLTDESEILRFLQHGTLVGLLPVPHPILIRRYQANPGTAMWFRTYMWGVIYLRNIDPAVWYDTDIKLFQVQRI